MKKHHRTTRKVLRVRMRRTLQPENLLALVQVLALQAHPTLRLKQTESQNL